VSQNLFGKSDALPTVPPHRQLHVIRENLPQQSLKEQGKRNFWDLVSTETIKN